MVPIKNSTGAALLHLLSRECLAHPELAGLNQARWPELVWSVRRGPDLKGLYQLGLERLPALEEYHYWNRQLQRYQQTPFKAIFFYTSFDRELRSFIRDHWNALHQETGDTLDIYEFDISQHAVYRVTGYSRRGYSTFATQYIKALRAIPGADYRNLADGLPCMLLWSQKAGTILPLAKVAGNIDLFKEYVRGLLRHLRVQQPFSALEFVEIENWHDRHCGKLPLTDRYDASLGNADVDRPVPCDVFVSYSRRDSTLKKNVASAIEGLGLTPWIDDSLRCGELWARRLKVQINEAACTLVCLTKEAVRSPWVEAETLEAMRLGRALPILFDDTEPPDWVRRLHCPRMHPMDFTPDNQEVVALFEGLNGRR